MDAAAGRDVGRPPGSPPAVCMWHASREGRATSLVDVVLDDENNIRRRRVDLPARHAALDAAAAAGGGGVSFVTPVDEMYFHAASHCVHARTHRQRAEMLSKRHGSTQYSERRTNVNQKSVAKPSV